MAKILFLMMAAVIAAVVFYGGWQKVRERRAYFRKRDIEWYAEKETDPVGYWFSVSVSFLFGFLTLAFIAWMMIAEVPVEF